MQAEKQVAIEVKKSALPAPQFPELKIGAVTEVFGVACMLVNVNTGKRRVTLIPVNSGTGVPAPVTQRMRIAPKLKGKK